MKVTRVAYSHRLNAGKLAMLTEQARRLGRVRSEAWQRYGGVAGALVKDRQVRDQWLAAGHHEQFGVLANAWKETLRDAIGDIRACRQAAMTAVRRAVSRRTTDEAERRRLYGLLKADRWAEDPYLSRQMRRHWRRGKNRIHNQIVVRSDQYRTYTLMVGGDVWLAIPGLAPRQMVRIPLSTTVAPVGTLRVILRNGGVEVHYQIDGVDMPSSRPCGSREIGVDKGYTEVVDKASLIAAEDLTKTFAGRRRLGKNMNRRLAAWTKGMTARALTSVSERRGSALRLVNAAYTSQVCPDCDRLGRRIGDRLYCTSCGVVWHADHAGAVNALKRVGDTDITLWTPHARVKQILQERVDRQRTRLPVQDSSPAPPGGERIIPIKAQA